MIKCQLEVYFGVNASGIIGYLNSSKMKINFLGLKIISDDDYNVEGMRHEYCKKIKQQR